jgi:hypothetical protein
MIRLVGEQAGEHIGKRQWWTVGGASVVVAFGRSSCGINITDQKRVDITRQLAEKYGRIYGRPLNILQSIDTVLIECPLEGVDSFLRAVEPLLDDETT